MNIFFFLVILTLFDYIKMTLFIFDLSKSRLDIFKFKYINIINIKNN